MVKRSVAMMMSVLLFVLSGAPSAGLGRPADQEPVAFLFAVSVQGEDSTNQVYRYAVRPSGAPTLELAIVDPSLDRPYGLVFGPGGEMFVVNRGNPWPGTGNGSVARFLNPLGVPIPNGTIESTYFQCPHGAAFHGRHLFVAQRFGSDVLRFWIGLGGRAWLWGRVADGLCCTAPRGVAFSPDGSTLFVSECCDVHEIDYYTFGPGGGAILRGVIDDERLVNPAGMAFGKWGELFVANTDGENVLRYLLDEEGQWQPNGELSGNGLARPVGLAFSPWGELFVSNLGGTGGISRWVFDGEGQAWPHGSFATPTTLGEIRFFPIAYGLRTYLPAVYRSP